MILVQNMLEELNSLGATVVTSVKELVSSCKYVKLMLLQATFIRSFLVYWIGQAMKEITRLLVMITI